MSSIAVVADSVGGASSGTTASAVIPGTAAANQLALAQVTVHNLTPLAAPTGWTILGHFEGASYSVTLLGKVLTSGDPGTTFTCPITGTNRWAVAMRVWSGTDTGALVTNSVGGAIAYLSAMTVYGAGLTSHTTPSISSITNSGCWAVWGLGETGNPGSTSVSIATGQMQGTTGSYETGGGSGSASSALADSNGTIPTGTLAANTFTTTNNTSNGATISVVIKPSTSTALSAIGYAPNQLANTLLAAAQTGNAAGTYKIRLLNPSYSPDLNNHNHWSDISSFEMPTANGYTAGGVALSSVSYSYNSGTFVNALTSNPVTWTIGAGLDLIPRYGALVIDTGTASTSPILAILDMGGATDAQNALVLLPDTTYGWIGSDQPVHG